MVWMDPKEVTGMGEVSREKRKKGLDFVEVNVKTHL